MIIGKINDDIYIDDAVLRETKQKVVINNQQITDLETFNKVVDSIDEKDKEISKLNKIIDIKTNRIQQLMKRLSKRQEKVDRLNNIIEETLQSVCVIEHNLEKYEEIGLDHFDYALRKTWELKEYLMEELKEGK